MRPYWSTLPRGIWIGMLVGLAVVSLFAPFLFYAGVAVMHASAEWIQPTSGERVANLVGWMAFAFYFFVVIGVPAMLGGLIGAGTASVRKSSRKSDTA